MKMRKQITNHIASFVLIVSLLLPIGISFSHALHNHEHADCNAKNEKHIHKQSIDCSYFHYISQVQTASQVYQYELFSSFIPFENPVLVLSFYYFDKLTAFLVRGPPAINAF